MCNILRICKDWQTPSYFLGYIWMKLCKYAKIKKMCMTLVLYKIGAWRFYNVHSTTVISALKTGAKSSQKVANVSGMKFWSEGQQVLCKPEFRII